MKKKISFLVPIFSAMVLLFLITKCEKETTYPMKIVCYFSQTGVDTGAVAPKCHIEVGRPTFADYARAVGTTDAQGVFNYTFQYEALLDVNATTIDSTSNPDYDITYAGSTQVKLVANEVVEKGILLTRVD